MDHAEVSAPAGVEKVTPPVEQISEDAEAWADRLMTLLDVAQQAFRKGDGDIALLALKEGIDTAPAPKRPPDP